jgi:DNA adenine methylase
MIEPFLKWPGGKRWLVSRHRALFPSKYNKYFEPFLGAGAVFFSLQPRKAVLSDSNAELANTYKCIKSDHLAIEKGLAAFQKKHSSDFYYRVRESRPVSAIDRAIRFLYLNRTCFNGIYRVNREGVFNVPIGTKDAVSFPQGYLEQVAKALKNAQILPHDFEKTIDKAQQGDFLFIDPPYTVMHNNNGFVKYNSRLFSWPDQARLAAAIKRASKRDVLIMMSNADHDSVRALYDGFGNHFALTRSSILAGDPSHRRSATELLLTNYSIIVAPGVGNIMETTPRQKLIARINRKDWWHVPPTDPKAYQKRGMFLASTFREAEFWGRPLDEPIRVNVTNPLIGDERGIETELLGAPCKYPGDDDPKLLQWRWNLDSKLKKAAVTKGYDAIVLLSASAYAKFLAEGKLPISIELNLLSGPQQTCNR